jgi:hypothetical protein
MKIWQAGCLLLLAMMFFLKACSYGYQAFPISREGAYGPIDYVLQLDEFGWLWEPEAAERALRDVAESSGHTNTIVLLFVHGWHHNAAPDDAHASKFAQSLAAIRQKLSEPLYVQSRINLTGDENVRVIGIYVGWRGKALPMPLNYATFWGRKAAAERVGDGDLREFLLRLNRIYRDRSDARSAPEAEPTEMPFMGLVSMGHSFGSQVLFKVVANVLEQELIHAELFMAAPKGAKTPIQQPLRGLGDLTVLINPAFEALQYHRVHQLSARLEYDRRQTPLLLVLSAEDDLARRVLFPIGRWLDALFGPPFRKDQRRLWTSALGEYEPQRTHEITEVVSTPYEFDPEVYIENPCLILDADLSNLPWIAGVRLRPTIKAPQPFSPFMVAYTSPTVLLEHSGIFEESLWDFLIDYVAIVEGKKMLLGDKVTVDSCPPAAAG